MRFFSPITAPSSSRAPGTGVSSRTSVGSRARRATWCRMRGWPRWLSNRGASGSLPTATTPVFQASDGGSRFEPRSRGRFNRCLGGCPFLALWAHQRAANASKRRHKAKGRNLNSTECQSRIRQRPAHGRKVRLTFLFPPLNRRVPGSNPG
jgi:hypothetical protein